MRPKDDQMTNNHSLPCHLQHNFEVKCEIDFKHPSKAEDFTPEQEGERLQRAFRLASAVLVPTGPSCEMYPQDRRVNIKRSLRSRAGIK